MAKKGKTGKKVVKATTEEEEYYPLYVQSSNPTESFLDWVDEMNQTRIVYLQVGNPPPPPCPPGGCQ